MHICHTTIKGSYKTIQLKRVQEQDNTVLTHYIMIPGYPVVPQAQAASSRAETPSMMWPGTIEIGYFVGLNHETHVTKNNH